MTPEQPTMPSDSTTFSVPNATLISRRGFLQRGLAVGAGVAAVSLVEQSIARPAFALARAGRPQVTHGVQSGDVTFNRAVVWARADRPSLLLVDVSTDASFRRFRRLRGPLTGSDQDFTAQLEVHGLPAGETAFYRAHFADPDQESLVSEAVAGRFRTAPTGRGDISFCWSGDTAGQGWGINPDFGGMRIYETMRTLSPDFFIHSGDTIYADGPILPSVALPDGGVWRNLTTPEKSKVAETLDEFRGNYRYNLMDDNVRRFNAEVPVFAQWDDHETTNNWYPGEILDDPRYQVKDVDVLAARAKQAFQEYQPIEMAQAEADRIYRKVSYGPSLEVFFLDLRSYRGPNTANDQPHRSPVTEILAERQLKWLKRALRRSQATWKVIASDMPVGLVIGDGATAFEGIAQGQPGALGRELEVANLLSFIRREQVRNVVWFTADVHYTAAHHYDPARALFTDFDPFWEFVSGPLNAGTFGPNSLDPTFGPEVRFQRAADRPNQPPSDGLQFFGHTTIDGFTEVMTVRLRDLDGAVLHQVDLAPQT